MTNKNELFIKTLILDSLSYKKIRNKKRLMKQVNKIYNIYINTEQK